MMYSRSASAWSSRLPCWEIWQAVLTGYRWLERAGTRHEVRDLQRIVASFEATPEEAKQIFEGLK